MTPEALARAAQRAAFTPGNPPPCYEVTAAADGSPRAKVRIYGAIGDWFDGLDAATLAGQIEALDADEIEVHLNSPGGVAFDGIAIYNALRQHPAHVTVSVDGLAASAASVVAMAGDDIVMRTGSQMMIHNPSAVCVGGSAVMRQVADVLDGAARSLADVYASRAGGTRDDWLPAMAAETWYTAGEAVAAGLAHREDSEPAEPTAAFNLSIFAHAGREHAPAPTPRRDHSMTLEEMRAAIAAAVAPVQAAVEETDRRVAVLADGGPAAGHGLALPYNSLAEFVKALAVPSARRTGGDVRADAETIHAAYTGANTGDADPRPTWIERDIKLVESARNVLNLFSREALPGEGMTISYPKFGSKTGDVDKQASEGADLPYLELVVADASANVDTYGGYSELTRQVIERASVPYLAKVLQMQKISYGKRTNAVVRATLAGGAGYNTATLPAAPTAVQVLDLAVDSAAAIEDNSLGLDAEFWLMSRAAFKAVMHITDSTGRPIFVINGDGQNTVGTANPATLRGTVAGLPFLVDPGMTGNFSYVCSSQALTVLESPGAPFNLTDENIINLTKQFSLYGYLAMTLNDAKGVVKVTHAAS